MTTFHERSGGVIPYRIGDDQGPTYLVLHSATVRNPRAKWEFPKGGVEPGESTRQAAAREFQEETALVDWAFREGFERSLSYTYIRRGRKIVKTVTYYLVEVNDPAPLARSPEHVEDQSGKWHQWGTFDEISILLYHTKIRHVFTEADAFLRGSRDAQPTSGRGAVSTAIKPQSG
jgi:8-oxo-dGTP pyrophosphatase MutT (NUDIX family)